MASASRGNIIICDTATGQSVPPFDYGDAAPYDYSRSADSTLQKVPVKLRGVLMRNTAASATLVLQDGGNADTGLDPITLVDLATSDATNDSTYFPFDPPVFFPNGIIVDAITNCSAHLFIELTKGQ